MFNNVYESYLPQVDHDWEAKKDGSLGSDMVDLKSQIRFSKKRKSDSEIIIKYKQKGNWKILRKT